MNSLLDCINFLSSPSALKSLERDPYWPKWDSPWWHMLLLHELGRTRDIPENAILKMVEVLKQHYLPFFPRGEESAKLPPGTDLYRQVICFCALGNIYQVLFTYGVDVDKELPWMREWFFRYQLMDGGLNCDENSCKGSLVSTIACLEAVLFCRKERPISSQEKNFLDEGANYLLNHRLFRKISTGEVINESWKEVGFPRFYSYDFFRGFYFLAKWKEYSGLFIDEELIEEVKFLMKKQMNPQGELLLKSCKLMNEKSYNPLLDGSWGMGKASYFKLMEEVSLEGSFCPPLMKKWLEVQSIFNFT